MFLLYYVFVDFLPHSQWSISMLNKFDSTFNRCCCKQIHNVVMWVKRTNVQFNQVDSVTLKMYNMNFTVFTKKVRTVVFV